MKLPEICTVPGAEVRAGWIRGADCTMPSRTIATLFCGGCFENDAPASWLNLSCPEPLRSSETAYPWPCWNSDFAPEVSFPVSAAGPSRYRICCFSCGRPGRTTHAPALSSAADVFGTEVSAPIAVESHDAIAAFVASSAAGSPSPWAAARPARAGSSTPRSVRRGVSPCRDP